MNLRCDLILIARCLSSLLVAMVVCAAAGLGGCGGPGQASLRPIMLEEPIAPESVALADSAALVPLRPTGDAESSPGRIQLTGAGREWLDFTAVHAGDGVSLAVAPLRHVPREVSHPDAEFRARSAADTTPAAVSVEVQIYRVVSLPVDGNHAGFVRLYGTHQPVATLPRVLVPLERSQSDGAAPLFRLPNPAPLGSETPTLETRLWVDLRLPAGIERGRWETALRVFDADGRELAGLPIFVDAHGFDLPEQPSLSVTAPLGWDRLTELWPEQFGTQAPTLLSRDDPRSTEAVAMLDRLVAMVQAHRLELSVPALSPMVKWPAGRPPEVYWRDYDTLVRPWLSAGFTGWPVPRMPNLDGYPELARREYWQAALAHLDDQKLLDATLVRLRATDAGLDPATIRRGSGLSPTERLRLSAEVGRLARAYPVGRIAAPLEADQLIFAGPNHPDLIPPESADRLVIRGEGLVTDRPTRPWPPNLPQPQRFLSLHGPSPAPVPDPGASEADMRLWGWLSFLRGATLLELPDALPGAEELDRPIDPTRVVWFYPGERFGASGPVPSVQLKWLRRAQQDYEYLAAAAQRLEETYARVVARALVRPVRVLEGDTVDPLFPLVSGTPARGAWTEGLALVADKVAMADERVRRTLPPRFFADHTNRTTAWLADRERPLPIVGSTRWDLAQDPGGEPRLHLRTGVEIYNPSDARPEGFTLSWAEFPGGDRPASPGVPGMRAAGAWEHLSEVVQVPPVPTYEIAQAPIAASAGVNYLAGQLRTAQQSPMRLAVRNEYNGATTTVSAVTPAVVLDPRNEPPIVDGRLGEWSGNEAILNGPMVLMHNRPALQAGEVRRGTNTAEVFTAWTPQGLHVAFKFHGVARDESLRVTRNFVDTEYRRVWGEDVCQILVQPVWLQKGDPQNGPLLHIVAKPDGAFAERALDRRQNVQVWNTFESGLRYAASVDEDGVWRGEITLPWLALREAGVSVESLGEAPAMLRFNVSHHDGESGQSGSWAGPVDFGRDERFTGALVLRRADRVGFED